MRKLVSIILITYNQEDWVEYAVLSVLNQNYENLEIIISDDCSVDKTWENINQAVRCAGNLSNKIILNRNPKNLGITGNFTEALKYAKGDLIIMAAGDDVSSPTRVSKLVEEWLKYDRPSAIASSLNIIDEHGFPIKDHERNILFNYTEIVHLKGIDALKAHYYKLTNIKALGATLAYSREIFEQFGFNLGDNQSEDQILLGRSLLMNGCILIPDKLVDHRISGQNASLVSFKSNDIKKKDGFINLNLMFSKEELAYKHNELSRRISLLEVQRSDLQKWAPYNNVASALLKEDFIAYATANIQLLNMRRAIVDKVSINTILYSFKIIGIFRGAFEVVMQRCKLCDLLAFKIKRRIKIYFNFSSRVK